MYKYFTVILFIISWAGNIAAQSNFQRTYGEPSRNELLEEVVTTSDGGFISVGYSASYGNGSNDVYVVKTNAVGQELWHNTYGTDADDRGAALQQTSDGGYIVIGISGINGQHDIYLLKINANGEQEWAKTIGTPYVDEIANGILITPDGGYVIIAGNPDMYLLKTDYEGNVLWERNYENALMAGQSVQATPDGGYILCGTASDLLGGTVMLLVKTDAYGYAEWTQTIADAPNSFYTNLLNGRCVATLSDGGYVAVGYTHTDGYFKIVVRKIYANGSISWTKIYEPGITTSVNYGYIQIVPNRILQRNDGNLLIAGSYINVGGNQAFTWQLSADGTLQSETLHSFGILPICDINGVVQLAGGNVVFAGYTSGLTAPGFDALLFSKNASGNTLWVKTYGVSSNLNNEWGYSMLATAQNTYLLAGQTDSYSNSGNEDIYVMDVDQNGDVIWSNYYDYEGYNDIAWGIAQASDGGYVVCGFTTNSNGVNDTYLMKIDAQGNKNWEKTLGISTNDRGWGISATPDGGFVLAGQVSDTLGAGVLAMVTKTDANGNVLWSTFLGYSIAIAYNVKPTPDGGFIVVGRSRTLVSGSTDTKGYMAKLNASGSVEWELLSGSTTWARLFDVVATSDGAYLAVGSILDAAQQNYKMYLLKINGGGGIIWEKTVNVQGNNFGNYRAMQTADGNYAFIGNVEFNPSPLDRQGYLLKTNTYGNELWSKYYGNDLGVGTVLYDALQNTDGGFTLFGGIVAKGTTSDCYLIKSDELGNVFTGTLSTASQTTNAAVNTLKVFPNPNNGNFSIEAPPNTANSKFLLSVYAINGQKMFERIVSNNQVKGQLELHLPWLAKGIYMVQLQCGSELRQGKIIVQ